ncbi:hypothetical protein ACWD64_20740 [Streptomyces antibioticus]|nr:hypothetical protein [Streptomyces antibioticus]MCX5170394.1 hypothetical protein [Streptomyces antibioticus]
MIVAQASFIAVLLFYLGAIYINQYYRYFHLSLDSLNLSFPQLVLQSLQVVRPPALLGVLLAVAVLAALWMRTPSSRTWRDHLGRYSTAVSQGLGPLLIVVGLTMAVLWRQLHGYAWIAPLVIAVGFLLCSIGIAQVGGSAGLRRKEIVLFTAGICAFWTLIEVTRQVAREDAMEHASSVCRWTGVIILSAKPLSMNSKQITGSESEQCQSGVIEEKLHRKDGLRLPYRYTGLRLLVENGGRYYVVPVDWEVSADPVYVIRESDDLWIGLRGGVQSKS